MVDVINGLDLRVTQLCGGVETAEFTHLHESCTQSGQRFRGGFGADGFVTIKHDGAIDVLHWDDGVVEVSLLPGLGSALMGAGSVCIQLIATDAIKGGDQVGGDTLRDEVGGEGNFRI